MDRPAGWPHPSGQAQRPLDGGNGSRGPKPSGRERIRAAAYELFSRHGVHAVGVDMIVQRAGVAKMTLYRNFSSKDDLILDYLARRERVWTEEWLKAESSRRGRTPQERLLAIFDVFGEWFRSADFDGCAFLTTMLEVTDPRSPIHQASVRHLANIRVYLSALAEQAGVADPEEFAHQWHILMKGSIMAAHEGDANAALRARHMGVLLLRDRGMAED